MNKIELKNIIREEVSKILPNLYNIWVLKYITSDRATISPPYSSRGWGDKIKSQIEDYGDRGGYPIKVYGFILPQGKSYGESSFTFDVIDGGVIDNIELPTDWGIDGLDADGLKNILSK